MRSITGAFLSATIILSTPVAAAPRVPTGIYSLGVARDNPSTPMDERLAGIRDYDFVDGFTLRVGWRDLEPMQGGYDFTVIDRAIELVQPLGQQINLEILHGTPDYVIDLASSTYEDHQGGLRPVPWDPFAQSRIRELYDALAAHVSPDAPGGSTPLSQHPTIAALSASPAGLNFGVRDLNNGLRSHPEYTPQRYVDAVISGIGDTTSRFPNHPTFIGFFGFPDTIEGQQIDAFLIDELASRYNGEGQPRLAFFVENLSDLGPIPNPNTPGGIGNNLASWVSEGGETMIQALDSWLMHQENRDPQLMSLNPSTGIELAHESFGTRFFELYLADLDGAANGAVDANGTPIIEGLRFWHQTLSSAAPCPGDCDRSGTVDFADLVAILFEFGATEADSQCDADQSGTVDFADLVSALFVFGGCEA